MNFGVVILAAGASSRMGRPKLTLPWRNTSVIGHLVATWRELGAEQIVVVCAGGDLSIQTELDRLAFPNRHRLINSAPERGMFSSVQCASNWTEWDSTLSHFAIALGDQPQIPGPILAALLHHSEANPTAICQPSSGSRPGHPVILPRSSFHDLASATGPTLKDFLQSRARSFLEMADPALEFDIDYPEDYSRALKEFSAEPPLLEAARQSA